MDAQRFDALTKTMIDMPRRRVLGGVAAGTLGLLVGLRGREAGAQTCRRSRQCTSEQTCVHKTCTLKCETPFKCGVGGGGGCGGCFCTKKPGGGGACTQHISCTGALVACTKQSHCPPGQICGTGCCDPHPKFVCQPACPT
jgi:hypothetical protein